jgi:cell division protease FtsH
VRALAGLRENRHRLDSLAKALLENETLDQGDAYAAAGFDRQTPTPSQPPAALAARDNPS